MAGMESVIVLAWTYSGMKGMEGMEPISEPWPVWKAMSGWTTPVWKGMEGMDQIQKWPAMDQSDMIKGMEVMGSLQ